MPCWRSRPRRQSISLLSSWQDLRWRGLVEKLRGRPPLRSGRLLKHDEQKSLPVARSPVGQKPARSPRSGTFQSAVFWWHDGTWDTASRPGPDGEVEIVLTDELRRLLDQLAR